MPDGPTDGKEDDGDTANDSGASPETRANADGDGDHPDDPYVHRAGGAEPLATAGSAEPETREFGRSGWALVVGIAIAFLVVPALIYWRPPALPFEVAFLILPLLPAVLLALLAVWVTTTT